MSNVRWTADTIPHLTDKVAIITGANSGLGYESALALAGKGAQVVIASRNQDKAKTARDAIYNAHPNAILDIIQLDLANLESVQRFAETFTTKYDRLDILMNNAGVMALPPRKTTDGFEMQFGTNHLGHFALTGRLLDLILATPNARVVTVSSSLHRQGKMNFDDLQSEENYAKWDAYAQSKLANLLFAFELQRKLEAVDSSTISVGAHPGYSGTNLQTTGPDMEGSQIRRVMMKVANVLFSQSAAMGALPQLYAAVGPDVKGGEYYGPGGLMEMRGYPTRVKANDQAYDNESAARLWTISKQLTGVTYQQLTPATV